MNLHALQPEIDALEDVLRRAASGEGVVAAKVTLAWHLRQRDGGRTLQLVRDVMPIVRASRSLAHGDVVSSCHARAALAAAEASALLGDVVEAERCLIDARANVNPAWDPQAEGDAWLVESVLARTRGQADRSLAALLQAVKCFKRVKETERLEIAQAWIAFERAMTDPQDLEPQGSPTPGAEDTHACDAVLMAARARALSSRNPAAATRAFAAAGELAHAGGLVWLELACQLETGAVIHELGDYDRAARCFDAAALRARAMGWPALVVTCDTHFGALLCDLGAFDESQRTLEAAVETLSALPRGLLLANAHAALARTLLVTRRIAEAVVQMDAAMSLFRAADSPRHLAVNLILHARVLAEAALPARAVDALAEATALVDERGFESMRVRLHHAQADVHHRYTLAPPADMSLPSAALHFAESALAQGQRLTGWNARAPLLDFLAERWADTGNHELAYAYARRALAAEERETAQKMSYPLALLRVRRQAQIRGRPGGNVALDVRDAASTKARSATPASRRLMAGSLRS